MRHLICAAIIITHALPSTAETSIPNISHFHQFYEEFTNSLKKNDKKKWESLICYPFTAVNVDEGSRKNGQLKKLTKNTINTENISTYLLSWDVVIDYPIDSTKEITFSYENSLDFFKKNPDPKSLKRINPDAIDVNEDEIKILSAFFKKTNTSWCWYKSLYQTSGSDTPKSLR